MHKREELKQYALKICVPMMERTIRRAERGEMAYKADQVGFIPSMLENFCRPFWGIAPIIAQGEEIILNVNEKKMTVFEYLRSILLKGLSRENDTSWDKYKQYFDDFVYENQNITELAGLMIGIYFAKEKLWEPFKKSEKDIIAEELYEMSVAAFDNSWPNNHYWFPLFTVTVLKKLGYIFERTEEMLSFGLDFLDSLYIGDGWYKDGEFGRFDYYEAWSLHLYPLLWTLIADASFKDYEKRKQTYIKRTNEFLDFFTHWFDKYGAHVPFGRSLSYRFAASALFPIAVVAGCDIEPSLAGRVMSMNVDFFKQNCKIEESDILPEGYLYRNADVIEGYTSDGGAYWCCKAFLALLLEEKHPFWNYDGAKLPSEKKNYLIAPKNTDVHMLFEGHNGLVTMYNNTAQYYLNGIQTHKFGNLRSWYGKFAYNSAAGFACAGSDNVSVDSMISLMTPDLAMTSHRLGFNDMGYENGVLHSVHIPFSNDADSFIETWLIPLGGMHVRVHKVTLLREYYVCEGGFSLSRWDDYAPKETAGNYACVKNHKYCSKMKAVSNAEIELSIGEPQSGFHLYAPLASYPMYITKEPLAPGEYIFASAHCVCENDDIKLPQLIINGNSVIINCDNTSLEINVDNSCVRRECV